MIRELVAISLLLMTVIAFVFLFPGYFVSGHESGWTDATNKTKLVTIEIQGGQFHYCGFGNPNKSTVVCDSVTRNKNISFTEMDWIIEEATDWMVSKVNISEMAEK